ncbi:DUF4177 domain-containing protein [Cognatiyoonia sp. IB215446]|uniref:DUF4177 domain-containing protein n=1 Tax=Cognatiyoonia sp. IB215446 TaxID=3097355 RepID=UPI002A13D302|nr:DUF4177 domain-containing protein [Cognatiyoonia sp. IB215446]MDX8348382.1 DUF4177 domain-containing protein [Cognatiyoonia sp. IB215446]
MSYEYKVVPAPTRGLKAKGVKTAEDRFAHALATEMNTLAADGWEYLRADTLPSEQREGLMGKTTVYQNMLVFRRVKEVTAAPAPKPVLKAEPPVAKPKPVPAQAEDTEEEAVPTPIKTAKPPASEVAAE